MVIGECEHHPISPRKINRKFATLLLLNAVVLYVVGNSILTSLFVCAIFAHRYLRQACNFYIWIKQVAEAAHYHHKPIRIPKGSKGPFRHLRLTAVECGTACLWSTAEVGRLGTDDAWRLAIHVRELGQAQL